MIITAVLIQMKIVTIVATGKPLWLLLCTLHL